VSEEHWTLWICPKCGDVIGRCKHSTIDPISRRAVEVVPASQVQALTERLEETERAFREYAQTPDPDLAETIEALTAAEQRAQALEEAIDRHIQGTARWSLVGAQEQTTVRINEDMELLSAALQAGASGEGSNPQPSSPLPEQPK
jgi:transposase